MGRVHGRVAARLESVALMRAGQRAEGHGRVGRAVGRRADFWNGYPQRVGGYGISIDVGELALICAEAERGIALDVLDGAIVLAHGEVNIGCRHVVLEVDEGLLAVSFRLSVWNAENTPRGR